MVAETQPQLTLKHDLHQYLSLKSSIIRNYIIDMVTAGNSSHMGCALSITDILTVLYHCYIDTDLIKTQSLDRDYVILSKGHAASALYATLATVGLLSQENLTTYYQNGSLLLGHPVRNNALGVEASTGSLGHGLPMAVGLALAAKHDQRKNHTYVIVGDGECQEGTIWESIILATRFQLDNLTIIVDYNNLQGLDRTDDLVPGGFFNKFKGFGCLTLAIDGHNYGDLIKALSLPNVDKTLKVIIAKTSKGRGISFIQDKLEWHYKTFNAEQFNAAKKELSL
ncbi:transketolase [Candidatus Dependentiae bacterium]|nr:transketolase [Candidatus Dependentiae bacterium]